MAYGISAVIGTELKSAQVYYSRYYNMKSSDGQYEDVLAGTGLPIAPQKTETGPITSVDPLEGSTKRVTFNEWAIGFEVSRTAWEDDRLKNKGSALRDAATGIADSLRERVEVEAHRPLNGEGFDGSTYTVLPDSSGLFATSHSPVTGGEAAAQSNRTDIDLGVSSYRDATIVFKKWVNDRGLRIPGYSTPVRLIIPVDLEYVAREIIQSPDRPDTPNRAKNVSPQVEISATPYKTDTDSWVLQGNRHKMDFYWRSRPRFENFDDRRRRVGIFVGWERFKEFPNSWIGMWGSTGA
jgi:hypothetical protein